MAPAHDKNRHNGAISSKHGKSEHNNDKAVFLPKKRRTMTAEKTSEMEKLFDSISNDPFYENEFSARLQTGISGRNDPAHEQHAAEKRQKELESQYLYLDDGRLDWLYEDFSDDDDQVLLGDIKTTATCDLSNMATQFLDPEQSEQLQEALEGTDHNNATGVHFRFFSKRCKLPEPFIKNEISEVKDQSVLSKYKYVVSQSQSDAKRKLLSSGILPLWYQHGWNCPHSVYQWLMEVVAFDKDLFTAKQAMIVISSFWTNLPTVKLPLHPSISDGVNYDRNMSIETFSHIMKSYGAIKLPTIPNDKASTVAVTADIFDDTLPLMQLEWVLQLLTKSLLLWPEAYTTLQLQYIAKILLGIGVDGLGAVILRSLQDCLQACLLALPLESWESELRILGCSLCDEYHLMELQVNLMRATKPVCNRCSYLRRVIALAALELAYIKDTQCTATISDHSEQQQQQQQPSSTRSSPSPSSSASTTWFSASSSLLSSPASVPTPSSLSPSGSQTTLSTIELISPLMLTSANIFNRMVTILQHPNSMFSQSNPDYRQLSYRIYMLENALGNDYAEFIGSVENLDALVTQLKSLGRRIGGRLGTLDKSKANEAIQRLWSRLIYVTHQHSTGVQDENL